MLFLGVVALVMPAVFDLSLYGSLDAAPPAIDRLSFWSAIVLIARLRRQPDLRVHGAARSVPADARRRTHGESLLPTAAAVGVLAVGTVLTTVQAEILVGAMEPALAQFGFTELFVGVIVDRADRQRRRALFGRRPPRAATR